MRRKDISKLLRSVSRKSGRAILDYGMIDQGDRIAVAVSGGKDSMCLLHVLRHRQRVSPVQFHFEAVHIDFSLSDFDPQKLFEYCKMYGFDYRVEKVDGLKGEAYDDIDCFRWSWHRRKALFQLCAREGFTKIAFGHHMDDIAETILLNQFYRGEVCAMKPCQSLFEGKIQLIRPLAYERERTMMELANELNVQSIGGQSKCANDDTSHRMILKTMLRNMEKINPNVVPNIFRSLHNVRMDYLLKKICRDKGVKNKERQSV